MLEYALESIKVVGYDKKLYVSNEFLNPSIPELPGDNDNFRDLAPIAPFPGNPWLKEWMENNK